MVWNGTTTRGGDDEEEECKENNGAKASVEANHELASQANCALLFKNMARAENWCKRANWTTEVSE